MTPTPPNFDRRPTRYDPGHSVSDLDLPVFPPCPTCNGSSDEYYNTPGHERDAPCPTCRGHGVVYGQRLDLPAPEPGPPWWVRLIRLAARLARWLLRRGKQ